MAVAEEVAGRALAVDTTGRAVGAGIDRVPFSVTDALTENWFSSSSVHHFRVPKSRSGLSGIFGSKGMTVVVSSVESVVAEYEK